MLVYLAHPIDQVPARLDNLFAGHPLLTAVSELRELAGSLGHGFFRPSQAYSLPSPPWDPELAQTVDEVNRYALGASDAVVAVLPPGVATLGTPAEVEQALVLNRPVVLVTTAAFAASSVQVQSWLSRGCSLLPCNANGHLSADDVLFDQLLHQLPNPLHVETAELLESGPPALLVSGEAANLKERTYVGDAGLDLALAHEVKLAPGEFKRLGTGVHVAVPDGYYGLITARSSTWSNHRCTVVEGVIDAGYRGELTVGLRNEGEDTVWWQVGSRPAQFILLPVWGGKVEVVAELPEADRGHSGYGSTGT